MRTLLGVGTPKQWMAGAYSLLEALIAYLCGRAWRFRSLCAEERGISSLLFLISSESQPLHETTAFFNSLLGPLTLSDLAAWRVGPAALSSWSGTHVSLGCILDGSKSYV